MVFDLCYKHIPSEVSLVLSHHFLSSAISKFFNNGFQKVAVEEVQFTFHSQNFKHFAYICRRFEKLPNKLTSFRLSPTGVQVPRKRRNRLLVISLLSSLSWSTSSVCATSASHFLPMIMRFFCVTAATTGEVGSVDTCGPKISRIIPPCADKFYHMY